MAVMYGWNTTVFCGERAVRIRVRCKRCQGVDSTPSSLSMPFFPSLDALPDRFVHLYSRRTPSQRSIAKDRPAHLCMASVLLYHLLLDFYVLCIDPNVKIRLRCPTSLLGRDLNVG